MMSKSFEIGFKSAFNAFGSTKAYKPGNRKVGGQSLIDYDAGFEAAMLASHEKSRAMREWLAWLNEPKATRGPRPQLQVTKGE